MKTFGATFRDTIEKSFGKNRAKLFSNFTRHHLITHTPFLRVWISLVPIALRSIYLSRYSPLWKRVIAWERSRAASGYGIIWGDADRNKQEEFSAECHSVDCF